MRIVAATLVTFFYLSVVAQPSNQKVPFRICDLVYDTASCYYEKDTVAIQVSENVTKLDERFRICLDPKLHSGTLPIQVIIALDRSGSMRDNDPNDMRTKAAHDFIEDLRNKSPGSYVGSVIFSETVNLKRGKRPIILNDTIQFDSLWNSIEMAANTPQNFKPNPVLSKTLATFQGRAFTAALDSLLKLKSSIPNQMKQHIIMITDDGWFEDGDAKYNDILSKYEPLFPKGSFPKIHTVVLTGGGNPREDGVRGLENIKAIADRTGGIYIEDATPQTIVATLSKILETLTPTMDTLNKVTLKNLSIGESRVMTISQVPGGGKNDYIVGGSSWNLIPGENIFVFEKEYAMHDKSLIIVYDTMRLTRSHEIDTMILSINSKTECTDHWPGASFTALPDSVLVKEVVNAKVQIDPSFKFPYDLHDVSIKGFTTSNPQDASIVSLFRLDSNVTNEVVSGNPGNGTPQFNKYRGAFDGSMTDGSFTTTVPLPAGDMSFDLWVNSDGSSTKTLISSDKFSLSVDRDGIVTFESGSSTLKATRKIYTGVWTNVAVARKDGKVSIFINGLGSSAAVGIDFSGDQTVTVSAGSGFTIDETRFNSKSNIEVAIFGRQVYSIAQVSGMRWTISGNDITDATVDIPSATWKNNAIDFSITRSSRAAVILNMTRIDNEDLSWAINSNPVEFISPFPDPVPVIAEVMDENGNGFIDRINFTIDDQDTSVLATTMPSASVYFKTLSIRTYDDKDVSFQPKAIERVNDKTFTVTLNEHSGTTFETGWKSANFSTHDVSVMTSGAYTDITKVVDKAGPVIAQVVYYYGAEGKNEDTLKIKFSEPVRLKNSEDSPPAEVYNYYQREKISLNAFESIDVRSFTFNSDMMNATVIMTNGFFVLPSYDSLQLKKVPDHLVDVSGNSAHERSRVAEIEGKVRFALSVKPAVNPYIPGTEIPGNILAYYSDVLKDGNKKVVLVAVKSTLPLSVWKNRSFGSVTIYDCVGNIVQRDIAVYQANAPTDYGFTWDTKNQNKRNVNQGVYLAVIKVIDFYNTEHVFKVKIGIK